MAIKHIENTFNALLTGYHNKLAGGFVKGLKGTTFVDIEIGGVDGITAFKTVTNKLLKDERTQTLNQINTDAQWTKAIKAVNRKVSRTSMIGGIALPKWDKNRTMAPGLYKLVGSGSTDYVIIRSYKVSGNAAGNDQEIRAIAAAFRSELWDAWVELSYGKAALGGQLQFGAPRNAMGSRISGRRVRSTGAMDQRALGVQFQINTPIAHRQASTTAVYALRDLENVNPALTTQFGIKTTDIIEFVKRNLKLDYNESRKKKKQGSYNVDQLIEARFEKDNVEPTDIADIKKSALAGIGLYINEQLPKLTDIDRKGSKSLRDQITGDVIKDILDNSKISYKGKAVKAKITQKNKTKFDTKGKKARSKVKAGPAVNVSQLAMAVSGTSSLRGKRPEKDKREKVGTLQRIETLINKRLPAEVRRNMGRPALINQTGRFSNSTKVNLRETKAGISGEYTYLTSPYETFENTGSRRWPVGYNPKPLIAKSIRNLAMQYTAQKLVSLRRV